jgi:hypothetical protein
MADPNPLSGAVGNPWMTDFKPITPRLPGV